MPIAAPTPRAQISKIQLLMVNSTLHIGGAERVAAFLAQHLDHRQIEITACYMKESGYVADEMLRAGVDLVPIPDLKAGRPDYLSYLKLRRLIDARRIRVIHTHDLHGLIAGAICRLSKRSLRHVHTFHFGNYPFRIMRHKVIEGLLWRVPDALVAVGHGQAEQIRRLYGIPERRLDVIWNGVGEPTESAAARELLATLPPAVPVIASISTLIAQKGLEYLLEAAALLRQSGRSFVLLIAGDGRLREMLQAKSSQLSLTDCVRFLGWVPDAPNSVLPVCDIFVQSSLWEAMSIVVLEAMASGKAMVVTTVGENPHVVVPDQTALTVPPADAYRLAAALRVLLDDAELRARLGTAARSRYRQYFTLGHMISAHEVLYRRVAAS